MIALTWWFHISNKKLDANLFKVLVNIYGSFKSCCFMAYVDGCTGWRYCSCCKEIMSQICAFGCICLKVPEIFHVLISSLVILEPKTNFRLISSIKQQEEIATKEFWFYVRLWFKRFWCLHNTVLIFRTHRCYTFFPLLSVSGKEVHV